MFKVDFSFVEVDPPEDLVCENGHKAPELFRRYGPESDLLPTRFWKVSGKDTNKTICEPCLILVNYLASQKRKERNGKK